jgi:hypothetical protein
MDFGHLKNIKNLYESHGLEYKLKKPYADSYIIHDESADSLPVPLLSVSDWKDVYRYGPPSKQQKMKDFITKYRNV